MRRIKWRGYDVSFHDLKSETYNDGSVYRKWDIVLYLPFGAVKVGEVAHSNYKYRTWYAQSLGWYILGRSAYAWEKNSTAKGVILKMLDQAYPDMEPADQRRREAAA